MKKFIAILALTAYTPLAFSANYINGDTIRTPDRSKTWSMPSSSDTLAGVGTPQTLTNKTLSGSANTFTLIPTTALTGSIPTSSLSGSFPVTSLSGVVSKAQGGTGADNSALTFPTTGVISTTTSTSTLTNKTLTSPVITTPTGIVKGDVGLANVDNTSDATKNSATATLTGKTISGSSNTLTNIPGANLTGTVPKVNGGTGADNTAVTFPTTGTIPTTTSTDTQTNKTLTAPTINGGIHTFGTASSANRLSLPKAPKATLDGLTRNAGDIVFATDANKAFLDNGTALVSVGSGSGGINYVGDDYNLENGIGQWKAFNDAISTVTTGNSTIDLLGDAINLLGAPPWFREGEQVVYTTTGTAIGGLTNGATYYVRNPFTSGVGYIQLANTPTGDPIDLTSQGSGTFTFTPTDAFSGAGTLTPLPTLSVTTTGPIEGIKSLYYVPIAQTGVGFAHDFTIDKILDNQVGEQSFYYYFTTPASYNCDTSFGGACDLKVTIIDKTDNSVVSIYSGYKVEKTFGLGQDVVRFQTKAGHTNYRLVVYQTTTNVSYGGVTADVFKVSPQSTQPVVNTLCSVGSVAYLPTTTAPPGYVKGDGSPISRSSYSKLFALQGTLFGAGDGSTTFNVENLQGVAVMGAGSQTIAGVAHSKTLGLVSKDTTAVNGMHDQGHNHNVYPVSNTAIGGGAPNQLYGYPGGQYYSFYTQTGYANLAGDAETAPANIGLVGYVCYDDGQLPVTTSVQNVPTLLALQNTTVTNTWANAGQIAKFATNSTTVDNTTSYSATTGLFTCKASKSFTATVALQAAQTGISNSYVAIYKNGADLADLDNRVPPSGAGFVVVNGSTQVSCNIGDTIGVYFQSNSATTTGMTGSFTLSEIASGTQRQTVVYTAPQVVPLSGSGNLTMPKGASYVVVDGCGGGGGGAASGTVNNATFPTAGGTTTFGPMTAAGGSAGIWAAFQGVNGGSVTINSPAVDLFSEQGQGGGSAGFSQGGGIYYNGGNGGGKGGGPGGGPNTSGAYAIGGSCGGGGGGGNGTAASFYSGSGGGEGGRIRAKMDVTEGQVIPYSVGSSGSLGTPGGGANAQNGGQGSTGNLKVTIYFKNAGESSLPQDIVRSGNPNGSRHEWVSFGGSTPFASNCTTNPCPIHDQSGGITVVNRSSAGSYTVTFAQAPARGNPTCTCNSIPYGTAFGSCSIYTASPTSVVIQAVPNGSATATDSMGTLQCDFNK